ncbi:hypothetical protein [Leptospira weilii]|uniref:hypothetical protein n=1 Tax=Leptospira weilii TaxID=28184 RepID=UPI0012DADD96|nr:hypothetical protein [Leptospira weilii]
MTLSSWQNLSACACCTNSGEYLNTIVPFDESYLEEFKQIRFTQIATLFIGEADLDSVQGIKTSSQEYKLKVTIGDKYLIFSFWNEVGRSGTLKLAKPNKIFLFYVDTRKESDSQNGPTLYKEWRLTSKVIATGVFSVGTGQNLTLILQGEGNNCTSAIDFNHWILKMDGPKAKYHFFGNLEKLH